MEAFNTNKIIIISLSGIGTAKNTKNPKACIVILSCFFNEKYLVRKKLLSLFFAAFLLVIYHKNSDP
jgi:hypothetical protein